MRKVTSKKKSRRKNAKGKQKFENLYGGRDRNESDRCHLCDRWFCMRQDCKFSAEDCKYCHNECIENTLGEG